MAHASEKDKDDVAKLFKYEVAFNRMNSCILTYIRLAMSHAIVENHSKFHESTMTSSVFKILNNPSLGLQLFEDELTLKRKFSRHEDKGIWDLNIAGWNLVRVSFAFDFILLKSKTFSTFPSLKIYVQVLSFLPLRRSALRLHRWMQADMW